MPNGASNASPVTTSGRSAASSAAIIPPSDAPTTGHGVAPVASMLSQNVVSQSMYSSRGWNPPTPSKPGTEGTMTSQPALSTARMAGDSSTLPATPNR